MRFCEASAKNNFNVDEIFLKLVDDILSKVSGAVLLTVLFMSLTENVAFIRCHECFWLK